MVFKALIFDFDGIMTDTEPVHMEAWLDVLEPLGISFDEEEYRTNYIGRSDRDFLGEVSRIHRHHFSDAEKADLIETKIRATINLLEHDMPLLPGVEEFVLGAANRYLLAICSGANKSEIEFILRRLRWTDFFEPIISGESVRKGKPDPEGYIRALEGLNERTDDVIMAADVIAIEDSPKGIAAAKATGMQCLAVSNSYPASELAGADRVVASLADVDLDSLC